MRGRKSTPLIWTPRHTPNRFSVALEYAQTLPGVDIPETDVPRAGEGATPVGGPGDGLHVIGVALEDAEGLSVGEIPHPDGCVAGSGEGPLLSAVECNGIHPITVAFEELDT